MILPELSPLKVHHYPSNTVVNVGIIIPPANCVCVCVWGGGGGGGGGGEGGRVYCFHVCMSVSHTLVIAWGI